MKKILCLSLAMIFATSMFAQRGLNKNVKLAKDRVTVAMNKTAITGNETYVPGENPGNFSPVAKGTRAESDLLKTIYDLQGNSYPTGRAYRMADGTMGFSATISEESSHANRGSAYNYFNGSSWESMVEARNVEPVRSGWPTLVPYGEGEILVSHTGTASNVYRRETRGTGDWNLLGALPFTTTGAEYSWPRAGVTMDAAGNEYLHVYASYQWTDAESVVRTQTRYWRSADGGNTWDIQEYEIPGFEYASNTRLNSDYATITTSGSTIVILLVDGGTDVMYVRSDDNGDTWSHHYIYQNWFSEEGMEYLDVPMAADDTIDLWCATAGTGVLDNNGLLHVVLNSGNISRYGDGSYYSYGAGVDGISYWNEDMGQIERDPSFVNNMGNHIATIDSTFHMIAMDRNENLEIIGGFGGSWYGLWSEDAYDEEGYPLWPVLETWANEQCTFYRTYGLSTMPVIAIDSEGRMIVVFSTITKEGDYGGASNYYYRRLFAREYSPITGWQEETIAVNGDFTYGLSEVIYPIVPNGNNDGDEWNVFFSVDDLPGLFLDASAQTTASDNYYRHCTITKGSVAIDEEDAVAAFSMYPNPAKANVLINVEQTSTIEIYNMVGQLVKVINDVQGSVNVDVTSFTSGVYMVNVRNANGSASAQKLIVQ